MSELSFLCLRDSKIEGLEPLVLPIGELELLVSLKLWKALDDDLRKVLSSQGKGPSAPIRRSLHPAFCMGCMSYTVKQGK